MLPRRVTRASTAATATAATARSVRSLSALSPPPMSLLVPLRVTPPTARSHCPRRRKTADWCENLMWSWAWCRSNVGMFSGASQLSRCLNLTLAPPFGVRTLSIASAGAEYDGARCNRVCLAVAYHQGRRDFQRIQGRLDRGCHRWGSRAGGRGCGSCRPGGQAQRCCICPGSSFAGEPMKPPCKQTGHHTSTCTTLTSMSGDALDLPKLAASHATHWAGLLLWMDEQQLRDTAGHEHPAKPPKHKTLHACCTLVCDCRGSALQATGNSVTSAVQELTALFACN